MFQKQERLMEIARKDLSYQTWSQTFSDAQEQFEAYVQAQPEGIQNILWGYAAGGRMMNQRLVNLACEYMEFTEK